MNTYTAIRMGVLAFLVIALIVGGILIVRSKRQKKGLLLGSVALLCLIGYVVSYFIPFEEPFLTFPTAEEAFHYNHDDSEYQIRLVIDGHESTMVISRDSGVKGELISTLAKTESGWKPEILQRKRKVADVHYNHQIISIYQYKRTSDYYITVLTANRPDEISDNIGSSFQTTSIQSEEGLPSGIYYAFLDGFDSTYVLTIDGEKITFPDPK